MVDAYRVSGTLSERRVLMGHARAGQKIGLTYTPRWHDLGIKEPIWAPMYDDGVRDDGAFDCADLVSPRIEIEIVFRFAREVPIGAGADIVAGAIAAAALGFEIVDSHYPGWRCTPPDLVADFGCHAGLVTGDFVPMTGESASMLSRLALDLHCDDDHVAQGRGEDVLGGPTGAVVEMLNSSCAEPVAAGDLVSSGSLTRTSHPVKAGQIWSAETRGDVRLPAITLRVL
jgi:2-oxo-3-hexenedioate decarboxylase